MAKKKKEYSSNLITLEFYGRKVVPVRAESDKEVCTNCCFSFEGRPQRTCPKVTDDDVIKNLCMVIQTVIPDKHSTANTYFVEVH